MTLNSFATGSLLLVSVYLGISLFVSHSSIQELEQENKALTRDLQIQTQGRERAEWLLSANDQTMQVFSAIRVANQAARHASETQLNESVKQINQTLAGAPCADSAVPATAVNELLRAEATARAASGGSVSPH